MTLYRDGNELGTSRTGTVSTVWTVVDAAAGDGVHTYTATATDGWGTESAPSEPSQVRVDRTPPLLNVVGDPDGTAYTWPARPPRPTLAPSDAGSGVATSRDEWLTPTGDPAAGS